MITKKENLSNKKNSSDSMYDASNVIDENWFLESDVKHAIQEFLGQIQKIPKDKRTNETINKLALEKFGEELVK